jgi:heptosyltransferase-2
MPLNLVVQTAFLGDLLLAIPLLKRCKELWPDHQLGLVCRKGFGDFFLKTKLVDQIFEIQKGRQDSYSKIIQELNTADIQFLISPHQSMRTGIFCHQIKAKHKISFKNWWNFLVFDHRVVRDVELPDPLRQLSLLADSAVEKNQDLRNQIQTYKKNEKPYSLGPAGRLSAPPPWASMSLKASLSGEDKAFAKLKEKLNLQSFDSKRTLLLFPGSVWATKRWTESGFISLGQQLQKKGYQVFVMGGPGEEELADRVSKQILGSQSLAGKTSIFESALLILHSALVVGNDSASTHLASACETPVIAIFGPTVLEFGFRPWSAESYVVQKMDLNCRPCGMHGHKVCPLGTHVCMKDISSDTVLGAVEFALKE